MNTRTLLFVAAAISCALPAPADDGVELRWKLNKGDHFAFSLKWSSALHMKTPDGARDTTVDVTAEGTITVDSVEEATANAKVSFTALSWIANTATAKLEKTRTVEQLKDKTVDATLDGQGAFLINRDQLEDLAGTSEIAEPLTTSFVILPSGPAVVGEETDMSSRDSASEIKPSSITAKEAVLQGKRDESHKSGDLVQSSKGSLKIVFNRETGQLASVEETSEVKSDASASESKAVTTATLKRSLTVSRK